MTMPDYNDGKWHGWNGGECPVDPKSEVECRGTHDSVWKTSKPAEEVAWSNVIVFRVTKPAPPEPREWWAVGLHLHKDETTARTFLDELNAAHPEMDFGSIIHVREVLPE